MREIDVSTWKQFCVGDLFGYAKHGQYVNPHILQQSDNGLHIVSASMSDNGLSNDCYLCDKNECIIPAKVITWGKQSPMFAYQQRETISGQGVYYYSVGCLSMFAVLFVCAVMQTTIADKYNYQNCLIGEKADAEQISLPATPTGEPDWAYMESYMQSVMEREEMFAEHLASLTAEAVADGHEIDVSDWGEFRVGDLFEILLPKGDMQPKLLFDGDIPLVSAGTENNGIVMFVDDKGDGVSEMFDAAMITVSMFGQAFYQSKPFYAVSHGRINVLKPKYVLTDFTGMFLASVLTVFLCGRYGFATMCNQSRLTEERIPLPVTPTGDPNWAYMEQFMQNQMDKSRELVEHLDAIWN